LEEAVNQNADLVTRPGDTESRRHLDELRGRQLARVEKYREEIAATERELAPLLAKTGHRVLAESMDKLEQMPVRR
jgi:CRISPR/Cas system CSM-associated protein Csm2 small subunit